MIIFSCSRDLNQAPKTPLKKHDTSIKQKDDRLPVAIVRNGTGSHTHKNHWVGLQSTKSWVVHKIIQITYML